MTNGGEHRPPASDDTGVGTDQPATQPLDTHAESADAAVRWTPPPTGRLLDDRYELGEIIGRGGMSTVYRSYDHRTGRHVAVKVFRSGIDPVDGDQRYRREVMLLSALSDPGLVAVFDADFGDDAAPGAARYLVTEIVDGPTLSEQIKLGVLTEEQVTRLGAALCKTLAYVHDHDIVHRDVKPANVLLAASVDDDLASPKLVDFGIAITSESTRLTSTDMTLGTPNYLSPEQVRGEQLTPASDIYSLGLVLIEALTGTIAYPGKGVEAAMARLTHPPDIPPTTSPRLRAVLTEMTTSDPNERPDARQAGRSLDELASPDASLAAEILSFGPTQEPIGGHAKHAIETHRRRPTPRVVAAAAAAVVAALIGIGAILSFTGHKAPEPVQQTPLQIAPPATHTSVARHAGTTTRPRSTTAGAPTQAVEPQPPVATPTPPEPTPSSSTPSKPAPSTTPTTAKVSPTSPSRNSPSPPGSSTSVSPPPSSSTPASTTPTTTTPNSQPS